MQNRNNDMDNKLRQLENQSLPDLSKQDKHWQDMKQMLTPATAPETPAGKTGIWKWFVAAAVIGGLVWLAAELRSTKTGDHTPVANSDKQEKIMPQENITVADTEKIAITYDTISKPVSTDKITIRFKPQPVSPKKQVYASIAKEPCDKCGTDWLNEPLPDTTNHHAANTVDPKATLAAFFTQLEKPAQEFVIDNKRDTVIYGNDGTALLIPANTFNTNQKVTITLKEYYSYEDIITNKLSTSSDGEILISGGMIHLSASVNNEPLNSPQKNIRWFLPDTSGAMEDMQLFSGKETVEEATADHSGFTNSSINWQTTPGRFNRNFITMKVKAVDLRDLPYKTTSYNKYKGFFFQSSESDLSRNELRELLQKKYTYYDKVIIFGKKKKKKEWLRTFSYDGINKKSETAYAIGDTAWLRPTEAKIYKLAVLDTITYTNRTSIIQSPPALNAQLKKLTSRYSVDINSFGWINCDKFLGRSRTLIDYVVNIGDTASNYTTFIAFDKIKSIMAGTVTGNKVVFANVPLGESVKVISVGVKGGKVMAAIEPVNISNNTFSRLHFEETTPSEFRQQAASMDK